MKKSALSVAVLTALGGLAGAAVSTSASAALTSSAVLSFSAGVNLCPYGPNTSNSTGCKFGITQVSGSYFLMDTNGSGTHCLRNEGTLMAPGPDGGITIGTAQSASGSHTGIPNGSETAHIDAPWNFFGQTGMHFTSSPVSVVTDSGTTKTLSFSGWNVTWSGIPAINMGGGLQDCGTASDGKCVDANVGDISGTYNNGSGLATITCSTSSCSFGSSFTLDYQATVPRADASGFGGVFYATHLTGTVTQAVPVPAAAWLFGSGLVGLVGVARRKSKV